MARNAFYTSIEGIQSVWGPVSTEVVDPSALRLSWADVRRTLECAVTNRQIELDRG